MPSSYLWLIPLLPFTGFLINGTVGRKLPRALVSAILALPGEAQFGSAGVQPDEE